MGSVKPRHVAPQPAVRFKRQLQEISVKDIAQNPQNPREEPSRTEVSDIQQSLESVGEMLVPIVVYRNPHRHRSDPKFILLDGERRWRAATELAPRNRKFRKIPANIISGPLSDYENLRTMFNIHMKREEWSTAAIAEALSRLFRARPSLKKAPVKAIAYETGLGETEVREARQFLLMPRQARQRALSGDLDEYYLILLSRNMRSIQNSYSDLITVSNWTAIADAFIKKVDDGWINDARSFNSLGKAARVCLAQQQPEFFRKIFDELVSRPAFTPDQALERVEAEFLVSTDKEFVRQADRFLRTLKEHLKRKNYKVQSKTAEILNQLVAEAQKINV